MGRKLPAPAAVLLALAMIVIATDAAAEGETVKKDDGGELRRATLGGGCFWCIEAVFAELDGVDGVVSGYAGGDDPDPTYQEVCSGKTGHAEVVQVAFDPRIIGYREILTVFFSVHDPTTLNRQGADVGTQYRSLILYHDEAQRRQAVELIRRLEEEEVWPAPIVTEIAPFEVFHPAEKYHQDYYARNRSAGYCQVVIAPKLQKFRREFAERIKPGPGR